MVTELFKYIFVISLGLSAISVLSAQKQVRPSDLDLVDSRVQHLSESMFPLSQIASCDNPASHLQGTDTTISVNGPSLALRGRDVRGNAWMATVPITGLGCELFQADLDDNGRPDIAIWVSSIGDRGSYDNRLILLLFGKDGGVFPWEATGHFTVGSGGIHEILRDSSGAFIVQTKETGLAAWDGLSFLSYMYRMKDSRVTAVSGTYDGITFPKVLQSVAYSSSLPKMANAISLATDSLPLGEISPVHDTDAKLAGLGAHNIATTNSTDAPQTSVAYSRIDTAAVSSDAGKMILSNGSYLDLPEIMVVDGARGSRKIIFQPDDSDLKELGEGKYRIHTIGKDCADIDDCQPFIVWAR